jgi:hypothetical protein
MYRYMHEEIGVDEDATSGTLLYQTQTTASYHN